jgi:hypothetical protein
MTDKPDNRSWKNFLVRKDVQLPIITANLSFLAIVAIVLIAVLLSPLYYEKQQLPNETAMLVDSLWEPLEACRKALSTDDHPTL